MYVPYLINQALMQLTGINCAIFIVAAIQVFCAFYSMVFIYRIFREVIEVRRADATVLTLFFFSFAYVMVAAIVPDHFIISMLFLLIALYISGRRMKSGRSFKTWQTVLYFILTASTSLNNGLKIFLAALFVNRRRFFRLRFLLLGVILPSALIWGTARVTYAKLVWPREMAQKKAKEEKKAREAKKAEEARKVEVAKMAEEAKMAKVAADTVKKPTAVQHKTPAKAKRVRQGRPIGNGEFLRWTDITTSRVQSVVENLFGESIQLHQKHLLEDEFRQRPMIVHYSSWLNYVVEALVVLLFIVGMWCGRHSRFFWLCLSWFGLDMLLHVGMGFGLNEVYIMSAHWIFIIPIAVGFALLHLPKRFVAPVRYGVGLLTLYLWVYNVALIVKYLL